MVNRTGYILLKGLSNHKLLFDFLGKKSQTFRRVEIQQGRWHRVVIRFEDTDTSSPKVTLFVDCIEVEKLAFDVSMKETFMEDSMNAEIRLNQLQSIPGKDHMKFIVSS